MPEITIDVKQETIDRVQALAQAEGLSARQWLMKVLRPTLMGEEVKTLVEAATRDAAASVDTARADAIATLTAKYD